MSSEFRTMPDSNWSAQLLRIARIQKFCTKQDHIYFLLSKLQRHRSVPLLFHATKSAFLMPGPIYGIPYCRKFNKDLGQFPIQSAQILTACG